MSERQAKVIDFVPVRLFSLLVVVLLGLTAIATIEAIHIYAVTLPRDSAVAQLAALDVQQRGSLATWYSAAVLATAMCWSLVIFGIRAHRVDDYRGRYRIWLWIAAALVWLSLDAATGVHDSLGLALFVGKPTALGVANSAAVGCTVCWLALYAVVFGTLGLRLMIEIWPSLPSTISLLIAAGLYLVASLLRLDVLTGSSPLIDCVMESTVIMAAHVSLAAAIGLYARHVYLDAQGRLKVHIDSDKKKSRTKSRARLNVVKDDKAEAGEGPKFGAAASSPAQPVSKAGAAISKATLSSPSYDEDEDEDDEDELDGQRLSKSERRRLKKLARREAQRRAA